MNAKPNRVLTLYAADHGMPLDMHTGLPIVAPATAAALVSQYTPWARCYMLVRGGIKCLENFPDPIDIDIVLV